MMNIEQILDAIDDMLEESWGLPFSGGRCVVDADRVRTYIDDIRLNLPGEIKQAKLIVSDRSEIISSAKKEAEQIVRKAEERAKSLIAQEQIVKQAQARASEMLSQAQSKSKEMRYAAQEFSDTMLRQTEEVLTESLRDVKGTRQALRQAHNKK